MIDAILNCVDKFNAYFGESGYLMLYLMAIVLLLLIEKDKLNKKIFVGQILIFSIIYWCPITAYIITKYCVEADVYWRMFWLLPMTILIAYVLTKTVHLKEKLYQKASILVILCFAIVGSGNCIYNETNFQKADNWLKINQDVVDMCQIIKDDAELYGIEDRGVIVPYELVSQMKQYDGIIRMPYGREMLKGTMPQGTREEQIYQLMRAEKLNIPKLRRLALEGNWQYLVYDSTVSIYEFMNEGYRWIGGNANYNVYCMQMEITGWEVTQHGPRDINSSFYTIYNPNEGLIVIDGGWTEDVEYVREVINAYGGQVDAWILTHPHQDHIGAFTALYSNLGDIKIHNIYTVDMASPEDCMRAAWWDSVDAYNNFLSLNVPNIQYVYPGDVLELCGLKVEILSAFNEDIRAFSGDYINDGSMMFKVYGKEDSFLFCADVGVNVSDYLINKYGAEKLSSDYLQMGHHGFGGLSDQFYQMVNPKIAFFDAPDWLMYDETGRYDTPENIALMESMGSEIRGFNNAPNSLMIY